MKQFKKRMMIVLLCTALILVIFINAYGVNFGEALQKSIYFYDAEKCGSGVTGGKLEWRGDCHTEDVYYGGFHDAGDHVKFGLPQSYAFSTLGWGVYEFKSAYQETGEYDHMMAILKWFADYYLRCWNGSRFVYHVGEGSEDHNYWGSPELQDPDTYPRPSRSTADGAASDQCGGAAAALAIMYLNTNDNKYLDAAKAIYSLGKANRGLGYSGGFYNSSYDEDELSWGAVWLHIATGTQSYLDDILSVDGSGNYTGYLKKIVANPEDDWQNIWVHSWDTVWGGVFAKLAPITDDDQHWWFFRWNCEYWSGGTIPHEESGDGNYLATTPAGFGWLNGWGSARYNAAAQLQALVYTKETGDTRFADWARGQMEYILGDNPMSRSYEVGFGSSYAEHPHHRAAHGSTTNSMDDPPNHKHILWGALVGGPDSEDNHVDKTSDYIYNEVAIDYNAGFVGALAGLVDQYGTGGGPISNFPPPEDPGDEYLMRAKLEQENESRTQITIQVDAQPVHPPHMETGVSARYYFDISEMEAADQTINDVSVEIYYDENKSRYGGATAVNGPALHSGSIYYIEISWAAYGIYGTRELQFGLIAAQDSSYTYHWDPSNDPGRQGVTSTRAITEAIPVYVDGTLVYGNEPGGGPTATPGTSTATPTPDPGTPTPTPDTGTPTPTPAVTNPPTNLGDVNNDEAIDIVDALLVAQYYVGLPVTIDTSTADTNCDGTADIIDALLIAQYYVGLVTSFC